MIVTYLPNRTSEFLVLTEESDVDSSVDQHLMVENKLHYINMDHHVGS